MCLDRKQKTVCLALCSVLLNVQKVLQKVLILTASFTFSAVSLNIHSLELMFVLLAAVQLFIKVCSLFSSSVHFTKIFRAKIMFLQWQSFTPVSQLTHSLAGRVLILTDLLLTTVKLTQSGVT